MFSPAVPRSTSVVLAKNNAGQYCIVASLSTRPSTDVVFIDLGTGLLAKNKDKYTDEASALGKLRPQGYEVALQGCALLGYVAAGCTAGVLLATRVRKKCTLPGGHAVFLVVDSQWVLIPLQNGMSSDPTAAAQDLAFWTSMQQYTLNNAHYFCETADLSRPFPSTYAAQDPAPEFVWNSWLREPLRSLGLQELCPSLLQGAVECSQETHPSGQRYSIALLSRRSRRHPGTRYLARGLNSKAGPGNEIECELVVWTHPSHHEDAEEPLQWARVVWRRGTVPIWWGVNLQSLQKGLQAEVYVREKEPYKGTITYFRSLQRQHTLDSQVEAAISGDWTLVQGAGASNGQQQAGRGPQPQQRRQQGTPAVTDPSLQVPVTCVNLLHANPKKLSELMLSEHFHEAVRFVRKRVGGEMPVKVVNFDWHGNMGRLSEEKGIEGFWQFMDPVLRQSGLACGTMEPAEPSDREPQQEPNGRSSPGPLSSGTAVAAQEQQGGQGAFTAWPPHWRMRWRQQQHGIVRFNCADSLDRTNAATCFAMLPALEEGLRLLGIPLDCGGAAQQSPGSAALTKARIPSRSGTHSSSAQDLPGLVARADSEVLREAHPQGTYLGQLFQQELPPGWDLVNHQGRPLYVDHINKRTQWHPPTTPKPSSAKGFMQSAADMFKSLQRQSSPPRIGGGGPSPGHTRSSSFSNSFGSLGGDRGAGPSGAAGQFGSPDYPQSSHLLASPGAPSLLSGSPIKEPGLGAGAGASAGGSPGRGRGGSFAHLVAHATLPAAASPDLRGSFAHLVAHSSGARSSPDLRGEAAAGSVADVAAGSSDRPSTASEAYHSESPHIIDQEPDMVPWGFFSLGTVQEVRDRLYKDAVADYVEMFKVHGDIHSFLYTGSPAMHSHVLGLVVQGGKTYGASSGVGKLQNLRVAVQRRWNNTMSDASRQQAVELFLGLNIHKYYRGLELLYPVPQSEEQLLSQLDPADLLPTDDEHLHKSTELQHLPIQAHHGMLAVQQDLADLEPLDEDNDERAAAEAAGQLACEGGAEADMEQGPGDSLSALQQQVQRPAPQQEQHDPLAADLLSFGGPPAEHQLKQASGEAEAGGAARQQLRDLLL